MVFPARQERLDWQLVAEVDLASLLAGDTSQVIRLADQFSSPPLNIQVARLQAVLAGVAFCVPENEFGDALTSAHGLAKVSKPLPALDLQFLEPGFPTGAADDPVPGALPAATLGPAGRGRGAEEEGGGGEGEGNLLRRCS